MNNFTILSDGQEEYSNLYCLDNRPIIRSITGKITNQCGEPLKKASIKAVSISLEPIAHTLSNDDGEYTLIIPNSIDIKMIVSKQGFITVNTGAIHCEMQNFMIFCEEKNNCIVKGKVLYTNCRPANSLRIRISSADYNEACFSDIDGSFVFVKVPAGKYILTVDGNECQKKSTCITVEQNKDYFQIADIIVERKKIGATLHGIVTDCSGKPVSDAVIILYNQTTKTIVSHTKSNKDGVYFFGNLIIGTYYVEAYC